MNKTTYNYFCINDDCEVRDLKITKLTKDEDKPEPCDKCGEDLKQLGISTSISHIGTQEAMNKMRR
jgi:predicted SprT family Zn-dependent metalloprotease